MLKPIRIAQIVVFALILGAASYVDYEGGSGATSAPDATHTQLIPYGRGLGPHYVPASQFLRWEVADAALFVLLATFIALLYLGRRRRA